ncbi:penicillin-binding protein 2 [Herbaspirillum seropedicae]|uniref:Peptidoglycan D,D-transpeptidase FtsI n=1 Tax=Herbaspirillum seropedicae (strain SmR1) TaxID=757424 RepID=D8IW58_HERSS|nr:penicillin-binding protein 2 [Herbaspirillum seropedicae]ADJ61856.1 cell division FtsI protein/penicillin-binding protein 2 [Herbaspirillum seropedicae SmR1]AKN64044.1 cell division protein [Herbaspirillum seropedicae]AON52634.1 cell division FtsI protein/penicillin-binding protein 2 [Herbaspirillum seropedicae]MDR6395678.1 cell division protein FtsI (penicillin-binding protein 3) [Herbaspirillum seropedicae]NQE29418.1 cell division protein [Herbaspirillum seropedicae]
MTKMPPRTNLSGGRVAASKGVAFSSNPILQVKLPAWRSRFVLFVLFVAFVALVLRALWLQGVSTDFLQKQGASRYARTLELPATRGKITDRNGQVLASSVPVKAIWAIPEDVQAAPKDKLVQLAKLLEMSDADLRKKLDSDRSFVYLKRQVEQDTADKIVKLGIPGIETRKEYKRFYPEGEVMAHVVGFTNIEDAGQDGMELAAQKTLAGVTGSRRVIKDRLGRVVEDIESIREPHDGRDLTLSIDSKIQYIAFTQLKEAVEKFKAKAGGIIVVDAKTGEVLALANLPTYNPNDRSVLTGAQLRNRVVTDTFEPGSTMKPFTVALALDTHRVTPSTVFQTAPGKMTIGTATIGDSHAHGPLTVAQIIEKSSNIGTAKIALGMPPEEMWEMFTTVGFGQQPKFGFPGAVAGRVRPYKSWRPIEQATMSYGHGISVSLIQLAHAYLIFARNGDIIPLSFTKVTDSPIGQRVISADTALQMRRMLETVVAPGGTAPQAQVPGYRVGGKTGTAYKIEGGKYVRKYVASFSGIAPMSDPRLIISVMIDEPQGQHYGGPVAGPVFANVAANALRALNVPPDSSVTNIIIPKEPLEESM